MKDFLTARRTPIVEEWFARTLESYPPQTAHFLKGVVDRFRNPAGHSLRENLAALFDAVLLSDDWPEATRALRDLVQLRAVQDFTPDEAVAFIALLKPIIRDAAAQVPDARFANPTLDVVNDRIDRLTQLGHALHQQCRARIEEIRTNDARRRTWQLTRAQQ